MLPGREARGSFPRHVECRTTHALAYRTVAGEFRDAAKLTGRMLARQLAEILAYRDRGFGGSLSFTPAQQAHLVQGTVRRFCQGAEGSLATGHVPLRSRLAGIDASAAAEIRAWTLAEAHRLWLRMNDPRDPIPLGHDGYLKRWALGRPRLPAEIIFLDEAQDANGVVPGREAEELRARSRTTLLELEDVVEQAPQLPGAAHHRDAQAFVERPKRAWPSR